MSDLTQPITNPELAQAVADMAAQGSRASREAVLDIVISKARFLAPVTISPAPEQQESAPLGEGTAIQFQLLSNRRGSPFSPPSPAGRSCASCAAPKTSKPWSSPLTTMPPWSCGTTGRRALWWTPLAPACPSTGP